MEVLSMSNLKNVTVMDVKELDVNDLIEVSAKQSSSSLRGEGVLTIVNSEKNGKRLMIAKDVMGRLGECETIQISITKAGIVVGETIPGNSKKFRVKKQGTKSIVYAAGVVREITEQFGLDYSERVSMTFSEVEFSTIQGYDVAVISITN